MTRQKGLKPLINKNTRILILGSFPGQESLKKKEYYAKKLNIFWKIMSLAIREDLNRLSYLNRIESIMRRGIGLWDVIASCERKGSSDNTIRGEKMNDLSTLKKIAPKLETVCFNGKRAGKHRTKIESLGYETIILPSTSPANSRPTFKEKLKAWKSAIQKPRSDTTVLPKPTQIHCFKKKI